MAPSRWCIGLYSTAIRQLAIVFIIDLMNMILNYAGLNFV
jgi:hypothetical protein